MSKYLNSKTLIKWSCGVVVITYALHTEGPQFDPGRDHRFYFTFDVVGCW